ncbi:uncharacterized protein K460DRAFT_414603 [Cucurbitaria berberidis CBS 394.84]|uniref:Mid2 domain-containing protein n=1 Tax=Cucurbitaria berberidis CBS 394.84 TaxID=1168544 RepID=A0A9P4GMK2_9PLEO|nr:uncharacterized protein K460DRAFT_414603 [Cucurbitaria berberidis CBS 394.84]KAF1847962.1 hypothetical protein K460DRAFT_414603 [Cucurbitaria berberidis CBS 394.84]
MTENTYTPAAPGDFFCPAGGTWYACQTGTKFIGCCTSDPCGTGCFGERLRPAGVSTKIYDQYPGGSCGGNTDFWTCLTEPTFWGCCNSDPCKNNSTCAVGHLEPTFMKRPDQIEYFGALNVLLSSTIPSTSSPSATATASLVPPPSNSGSSTKVSGAVIGGAVGGAVALVGIIGVVIFCLCYRKKRKQNLDSGGAGAHTRLASDKYSDVPTSSPQFSGYSPPPTYSYESQAFSGIPQELPAESANNRYSELPAQTAAHRFSELPAGATEPRELESPEVTPRLAQTEFASDAAKRLAQGLGLTGAVEDVKR